MSRTLALTRTVASTNGPWLAHNEVGFVWGVAAVVTAVLEVAGALHRRSEATKRDAGSQIMMRLFIAPGIVLLVLSFRFVPEASIRPPLVAAIVGLVVFSSGEALRVWSRASLGRYFTYSVMTSPDQPVVTSGPYRYVRHPSYTGILMITLGAAVTWGNWVGVAAIAVATFAALLYRIRIEERALLEDVGERYAEFSSTRKRLIPGVW